MNALQSFKEKLARGEPVFGPFMKTLDASFVEITGYAGFDFAILDMEHGPAGFADMQNLIRGAQVAGLVPIVRASDSSETAVSKALDLGAGGVQAPQIQSAAEARAVVNAARYFPRGERGVCRFVRAAKYSSIPRDVYFKQANEALVILQVEGQKGLDALDEILAVEGVDILFIGPYDLSQSLGVPGDVANPVVVEAIKNVVERAKKARVVTGVFADTFEAAVRWRDAGVQYLSYSTDVGLYTEACRRVLENIKKPAAGRA
jgi:4-hydroxy-2-oxoheptanedioate aldolase